MWVLVGVTTVAIAAVVGLIVAAVVTSVTAVVAAVILPAVVTTMATVVATMAAIMAAVLTTMSAPCSHCRSGEHATHRQGNDSNQSLEETFHRRTSLNSESLISLSEVLKSTEH